MLAWLCPSSRENPLELHLSGEVCVFSQPLKVLNWIWGSPEATRWRGIAHTGGRALNYSPTQVLSLETGMVCCLVHVLLKAIPSPSWVGWFPSSTVAVLCPPFHVVFLGNNYVTFHLKKWGVVLLLLLYGYFCIKIFVLHGIFAPSICYYSVIYVHMDSKFIF